MAAFGLVIAVAVPGLAIFGYFTSNFNFTVADSPGWSASATGCSAWKLEPSLRGGWRRSTSWSRCCGAPRVGWLSD